MSKERFEPTRFRLEQLAEGVYAAIDLPGMGAASNAGIIDLGDRTLVFDAFQTPQAAQELKRAAEALTGRPASLLVNSHFHADHVFGNQVFGGEIPIIASEQTRQVLGERGSSQIQIYREQGPDYLVQEEAKLAAMEAGPDRDDFAEGVAQIRELVLAAPTLELVLPNQIVEQRLVLQGPARRVELLVYEGHTLGDMICWLPEERICFMGDLVVVANHPWMGHGTPEGWLPTLDRLEALSIARLVPGHGEVAGAEWIEEIRQYIKAVVPYAEKQAAEGLTADEAAGLKPFAPYDRWQAREVFGWNMNFLVGRTKQ